MSQKSFKNHSNLKNSNSHPLSLFSNPPSSLKTARMSISHHQRLPLSKWTSRKLLTKPKYQSISSSTTKLMPLMKWWNHTLKVPSTMHSATLYFSSSKQCWHLSSDTLNSLQSHSSRVFTFVRNFVKNLQFLRALGRPSSEQISVITQKLRFTQSCALPRHYYSKPSSHLWKTKPSQAW